MQPDDWVGKVKPLTLRFTYRSQDIGASQNLGTNNVKIDFLAICELHRSGTGLFSDILAFNCGFAPIFSTLGAVVV